MPGGNVPSREEMERLFGPRDETPAGEKEKLIKELEKQADPSGVSEATKRAVDELEAEINKIKSTLCPHGIRREDFCTKCYEETNQH